MKEACSKCGSENVEVRSFPGAVIRPMGTSESYPVSTHKTVKCLDCNNEDLKSLD